MRAALYARISTVEQNTDMQVTEIYAYAQRMGWTIAEEYIDKGWSGSKASRPAFDELLKGVHQRRFDAVLVWKLDRWGRSLSNLLDSIRLLDSRSIRFIAITDGIDTDKNNPAARLMLHMLGCFAEFERSMIRERVKAGMAAARAKGKHLGRRRRIFDRDKARELRAEGKSLAQVSKALGVGKGTIQRYFDKLNDSAMEVANR